MTLGTCRRGLAARRCVLAIAAALLTAPRAAAIKPDALRSTNAVPAHLAGRFREPICFEQSRDGQYFVFDRRAHTVYGLDEGMTTVWEIVQIGAEAQDAFTTWADNELLPALRSL